MKRFELNLKAPALLQAAGMPALVLLCVGAARFSPAIASFPQEWTIAVPAFVNNALSWLVSTILPITSFVSRLAATLLTALIGTLQFLPWPAVAAAVLLISLKAGGLRLMSVGVGAVTYIVLTGFWLQSMATLSLVVLAVPLSVLIGFLLGLGAFLMPRLRHTLELFFDFMQTFPAFAYLLPLLLLFGFGPIAGLVATAIYAIPPMARCTLSGLTEVPSERREVAEMSGCTFWQRLAWVELPSARSMLALGFNQTTMAALSMVITASIIGGFDDVGWAVLSGLRSADLGKSLMAGLVIVMISIVIDRITGGLLRSTGSRNTGEAKAGWPAILIGSAAVVAIGAATRFALPALVAGWNESRGIVDFQVLNQGLLAFVARYSDVLDAITLPNGRLLDYPADWGTASANEIADFKIPFTAVPAGSEGALVAELQAAAAAEKPLLMRFWAPHWILTKVKLNWLDMPPCDPKDGARCVLPAPVIKVVRAGFSEKWPAAYELTKLYQLSADDQQKMTYEIDQNKKPIEDVVKAWVDANTATWSPWVDAAKK